MMRFKIIIGPCNRKKYCNGIVCCASIGLIIIYFLMVQIGFLLMELLNNEYDHETGECDIIFCGHNERAFCSSTSIINYYVGCPFVSGFFAFVCSIILFMLSMMLCGGVYFMIRICGFIVFYLKKKWKIKTRID